MNKENNTHFFNELEIQRFVPHSLFFNENTFTSLPSDWLMLYTDIVKSTELCNDGKQELVSKIAAAGIDIIIKSGMEKEIEMPYVYGGDGIFAAFPPVLLSSIKEECEKLALFAEEIHGIGIRICMIPVSDINKQDLSIGVKRVSLSRGMAHTLFDDRSFSWIEDECKKGDHYNIIENKKKNDNEEEELQDMPPAGSSYVLPLWEKILSPDVDEDFLCVVINPRHDDVLTIYHRITEEAALLLPTIFEENPLVAIKNIERISFDFIKSDGTLKMILAGDEFHIRSFIELLNELEQEGRIFFGSNSSHSSILTHVIETEERIYTGLLDVSDGGYIKASQVLKDKMLIDKKEI